VARSSWSERQALVHAEGRSPDQSGRWESAVVSSFPLEFNFRLEFTGVGMKTNEAPRVPQLSDDEVVDPELREVIDRAATTRSPPQSWYRTMGRSRR
jgi:hypothetical protein